MPHMTDRTARILDAIFVKQTCGWCGRRNSQGQGWQSGQTRWCSEDHAYLDQSSAA